MFFLLILAACVSIATACKDIERTHWIDAGCLLSEEGGILDCSGKNLKAVPTGLPEDLIHLWLNDNNIEEVCTSDFMGLYDLRYLFLEQNLISNIEADSFEDLDQLLFLLLDDNSLTELPGNVFSYLESLHTLSLADNALRTIKQDTFAGLKELEYLNLAKNQIVYVQCGALNEFQWLSVMNFNGNPAFCEINEESGVVSCRCPGFLTGGQGYCAVDRDCPHDNPTMIHFESRRIDGGELIRPRSVDTHKAVKMLKTDPATANDLISESLTGSDSENEANSRSGGEDLAVGLSITIILAVAAAVLVAVKTRRSTRGHNYGGTSLVSRLPDTTYEDVLTWDDGAAISDTASEYTKDNGAALVVGSVLNRNNPVFTSQTSRMLSFPSESILDEDEEEGTLSFEYSAAVENGLDTAVHSTIIRNTNLFAEVNSENDLNSEYDNEQDAVSECESVDTIC
eukprot:m.344309 g.344309  ORF g.344309 m.344309 type:complete len:455 (+) comp24156_c0_seq1:95-1459(+)